MRINKKIIYFVFKRKYPNININYFNFSYKMEGKQKGKVNQ